MTNNHTPNKQDDGRKPPLAVLLGIGLFALLNVGLLLWNPLAKVDPEGLPSAHTWVWWTAREFLEQNKAPDVVILGPSMLMHCIARQDANFLSRDLDYVHHHRSEYLANALSKQLGRAGISCFNFALPGAMMSDDYMVVHSLLKGKRKPAVLVLGVGARDFSDCQVHAAGSTPSFKYLKRFCNVDDIIQLALPQWWRQADYWLAKFTYLHDKKLDIQVALSESVRQAIGPWLKAYFRECRLVETDPARNMPGNMRAEVEEGMYVVRPNIPYKFEDNTTEYRKRYREKNDSTFRIQCQFFDKLMAECKQENIRVVLVNIPVTDINRNLMPQGNYERYVVALKETAAKYNALFLNIADEKREQFDISHFYDSIHMNASGGKKLLDEVASAIARDQSSVCALGGQKSDSKLAGVNQGF